MKACILTVIKDEHEYLDEWIKYHLDLGIGHIFIFEDFDSNSHKEICDKYEDKVTLDGIFSILSENDKQIAIELKKTKKWSAQHLYFKNALTYIKNMFQNVYDWCFVIDIDEFITLEKENTLENILSLYENYDAFTLSWKCYGADGHVKKPDYKDRGVVGTYLNEVECKHLEKPDCLLKTCYRIKSYRNDFFHNSHHPNNNCNWCNAINERDNITPIYTNIYLRHYITKSWEEYFWKLTVRGFVWGGRRNYDFFFKLNTDMIPLKDKLISDFEKETLIVLPYKQSSAQGNEIRLALKGWEKFCQFKYHFIVIGEFNSSLVDEFPWVEFITVPSMPKKQGQYTPHLDIQRKMKLVMEKYGSVYDGFIYTTDDEYPIKPFNIEDVTGIFCHSMSFTGVESNPASYWNHDKWKTRKLLDREGLPHINYTTHHPYYLEFKKLSEIWGKFNMFEESYVFDDVYFNYFQHEEPILDSTIRLGIWDKKIFEREFQKAIENPGIKFVCNSVDGWSKELEDELWKIVK